MQRLKKAIADYNSDKKEMQQRVAYKLFHTNDTKETNDKPIPSTEEKVEEVEIYSSPAKENPIIEDHKSLFAGSVSKVEGTSQEASASLEQPASKPPVQSSSSNLIILLGTSLAVVILSIFFAFYSR